MLGAFAKYTAYQTVHFARICPSYSLYLFLCISSLATGKSFSHIPFVTGSLSSHHILRTTRGASYQSALLHAYGSLWDAQQTGETILMGGPR